MTDAELEKKLRTLRAQLFNPPVPPMLKPAVNNIVREMGILEIVDACIRKLQS